MKAWIVGVIVGSLVFWSVFVWECHKEKRELFLEEKLKEEEEAYLKKPF